MTDYCEPSLIQSHNIFSEWKIWNINTRHFMSGLQQETLVSRLQQTSWKFHTHKEKLGYCNNILDSGWHILISTDNLKRSTCINPIMKINQNKLNKASTNTILLKGWQWSFRKMRELICPPQINMASLIGLQTESAVLSILKTPSIPSKTARTRLFHLPTWTAIG